MTTSSAERFWTIPNMLSLYRLIVSPFILYLIYSKNEKLFAIFIIINLATDILDGLIARLFNMQTLIGARLDSLADKTTYLLSFLAIYVFKWEQLQPHYLALFIFFIGWLTTSIIAFVRFGGVAGLHTYLFKITGYVQGAFIVILFAFNFYTWLFYLAICIGILACIEEIFILLIIPRAISNVKGLYWVLKNRT